MKTPLPAVPPAAGAVTEASAAWSELSALTPARIALGRSGVSLPTREVLSFGLAHARARDAVHAMLDVPRLLAALRGESWEALDVRSRADTRSAYLARPDWGRRLDTDSARRLAAHDPGTDGCDVVLALGDGLSALAVEAHALSLLRHLRPALADLRVAPLVVATQARVALADEVGALLRARVAICLIGERPGLSAPDSLGIYLTAAPRIGRNDAQRECISNIHAAGLGYQAAAAQLATRMRAALASGSSGVAREANRDALGFPPGRDAPQGDRQD